jgi:predicted dehydrogenase
MNVVNAYYKREHGGAPLRLHTPEDVDRLVDGLLEEEYSNSVAALCVDGRLNAACVPDHELLVAINNEDTSARCATWVAPGTYFTKGQASGEKEVIYYYTGSDREFPADSEIPIKEVRKALKEFLESGGERPGSPEWHDWPDNVR